MSGKVNAGTPWTRAALAKVDPDELAVLRDRVPDGFTVAVVCKGKPLPLGAVLYRGGDEVARTEVRYYRAEAAVLAALDLGRVAA